jgi:hypothetical protein
VKGPILTVIDRYRPIIVFLEHYVTHIEKTCPWVKRILREWLQVFIVRSVSQFPVRMRLMSTRL